MFLWTVSRGNSIATDCQMSLLQYLFLLQPSSSLARRSIMRSEEYSFRSPSMQPVFQETYRICTLFRSLITWGPVSNNLNSHRYTQLESQQRILVGREAEDMIDRSRREEELASIAKIKATTKLCPGCSWPIEKNSGCDHMKCKSSHIRTSFISFGCSFLQSKVRYNDLILSISCGALFSWMGVSL